MMRFILPVAALAVTLAALLMTPHDTRLFGLSHQQFASAAIGVSLLLWLALSGLRSARPSDIARLATAAMTWALLLIAMTGVYAYRFEASEIFGRITGELLPSEPQVERGGQVVINRRLSGEFAIAGRVNGARVTFLFDTGASAVVLTAEDARRAGVETNRLVFDVPVATANGGAMAAEVRLDQVAVGPIVMRNVSAMVARRGALDESLLGMSFLERLKSYTVERDRLVMVAK
jgi:aspartyl protease family protein